VDPLLGMADSAKTDYDAKGYFERAISIAQQQDKPLLVADVKTLAFQALSNTPLYTKAVKQYAFDAYDIYKKALPENALARVKATYTLGAVQYAHKQYDEAEPLLVEVIKQFDALDYTHPYALTSHAYLVEIYEQLDDRDKSTQHCVAIGSMQPWKDSQEQTPIFRVNPDYPMSYVKRGKSGWVEVEFTVDESGFVTEPVVLQSEGGSLFEKETIKTLEKWRYAPKFEGGKPVAAKSKVRLDYSIAP
ncbi:MAG TPA: TonB family protein, partial [Pseudomonadales bacterium]|nr:TonB family protein [Pseudomonadales bacterium]